MSVFVSDTATLMSLELCQLLETMLTGGITIVIPDLAYKRDFEGENGPYLRNLGLGIADLSPEELAWAQAIYSQKLGYSLTECFSLTIAYNRNYPLISENALLCNEIANHGGMGHGLLWLIDLMLNLMPTQKKSVLYGLEIIRTHPNYRSISSKAGDLLSKLK